MLDRNGNAAHRLRIIDHAGRENDRHVLLAHIGRNRNIEFQVSRNRLRRVVDAHVIDGLGIQRQLLLVFHSVGRNDDRRPVGRKIADSPTGNVVVSKCQSALDLPDRR